MGLRDIGCTLPPGFRFYPSDEELVCHYLHKKISNEEADLRETLIEIDLHICEPWQLPDVAKLNSNEWFFFSFRDRKYATGYRTNRATSSGYWKATGKDRNVHDPVTRAVVGMRKTLVFYMNRAPNGIKTGWIMHEFRLENPHMPPKEDWVLCRVFYKSRGENSNNFVPQKMYDHQCTPGDDSPNLVSSPTNIIEPNHHQNKITSSLFEMQQEHCVSFAGLSPRHYHIYHNECNKDIVSRPVTSNHGHELAETKCEDDYGLWFDTNLDYSAGVVSCLEDVRFDHDSSSIFI